MTEGLPSLKDLEKISDDLGKVRQVLINFQKTQAIIYNNLWNFEHLLNQVIKRQKEGGTE